MKKLKSNCMVILCFIIVIIILLCEEKDPNFPVAPIVISPITFFVLLFGTFDIRKSYSKLASVIKSFAITSLQLPLAGLIVDKEMSTTIMNFLSGLIGVLELTGISALIYLIGYGIDKWASKRQKAKNQAMGEDIILDEENKSYSFKNPYGIRPNHDNIQGHMSKEEYGEVGEQNVRFGLDFLKEYSGYKVFNGFYIVADNGRYQEIDHLIIGKNGIFHIETKSYKWGITILPDGTWKRTNWDTGETEILDNPVSQMELHLLLLKNVLGDKYPITNIIAIGVKDRSEYSITGAENCRYPIVHYKDIVNYIENANTGISLTPEEISGLEQKILTHMSKEKPVRDIASAQ